MFKWSTCKFLYEQVFYTTRYLANPGSTEDSWHPKYISDDSKIHNERRGKKVSFVHRKVYEKYVLIDQQNNTGVIQHVPESYKLKRTGNNRKL